MEAFIFLGYNDFHPLRQGSGKVPKTFRKPFEGVLKRLRKKMFRQGSGSFREAFEKVPERFRSRFRNKWKKCDEVWVKSNE